MSGSAQVTSVDAIAAFRASLVVYLTKVRPAVEQVSAEVARTRNWIQNTQRQNWENQLRLRRRKLEEAQAELFNARLSQFRSSSLLETLAAQRAERAVAEAEAKLALLRKWSRDFDTRAEPLTKQLEQFHGYLSTDFNAAVTHLAQIVQTLDDYTGVTPMGHPGASQTPAATAATPAAPADEKGPAA